jgi:hypothetical protein
MAAPDAASERRREAAEGRREREVKFDDAPKILIVCELRWQPVRMGRSALPIERESAMKRFEVGARVVEPTYGLGSVIAVEDAYTRVQFDEHGVKKFMTSMSKLEPSNEPVPAGLRTGKPRKKRTVKAKAAPAAVAE